ncbi:pyruvate dehydrogenase E1 component subunit beta-1, mitochondrial-like protein [Tanacetum coccineum]
MERNRAAMFIFIHQDRVMKMGDERSFSLDLRVIEDYMQRLSPLGSAMRHYSSATKQLTVRDALNSALSEEMAADSSVFVMGEEVGEYQGAYKITKGLLDKYGPERVVDTPITETGFTGIGVGVAYHGLRPVIEFMLFNFALQDHVYIDGIIYWRSRDSFIISFDLKSEKFGKVCLPEGMVTLTFLVVVNESLGLLEYYKEGGMSLCDVWMRKDGVNKPFTKIYTVKVEGMLVFSYRVLRFWNNGEVLLQLSDDDYGSQLMFMNPIAGRINSVG